MLEFLKHNLASTEELLTIKRSFYIRQKQQLPYSMAVSVADSFPANSSISKPETSYIDTLTKAAEA